MPRIENLNTPEAEALKSRARSTLLAEEGLLRASNEGKLEEEPLELTLGTEIFPDPQEIVLAYEPDGFPESLSLDIETNFKIEITRTSHRKDKTRAITKRRTYIRSDGYFATILEKTWQTEDGTQTFPASPVYEDSRMDERDLKRVETAISKLRNQAAKERKEWDY